MAANQTLEASVPATRIAHAFSIQLICRVVGMLASVVAVAMSARYLGPGRYGQLSIALVFVAMWSSLADLGVGTIIVRRVTSGRGELDRLVRVNSGLCLVYCVPLAVLVAVSGLLVYRDADVRVMIAMLSGSLVVMTMTTRFEPVFMTTVRFSAVAVSDLAGRLVTLASVSWLVAVRANVVWFAAAYLVSFAVQLAIQGAAASRHIALRPVFSLRETADLLRETLPVTGVMVLGVLYWRADGVILSLVSAHSEVGVYGLAYSIAFNTSLVSAFFLKSSLSTATELYSRDVAAFAGFLRRSVELMYFAAAPIAVVGTLVAGPLIGFFGDRAFVERGAPTLALLLIAAALRFVTSALGQGLVASQGQRFMFFSFVVSLAINVALNLVLDGRFGAVGAAAALAGTELFGMAFASWWLRRHCGYRPPVTFVLRLVAPTAAAVAVALLLAGQHVLLVVSAAAVAYLATSMTIGPVTWSTVASIRRKQVMT